MHTSTVKVPLPASQFSRVVSLLFTVRTVSRKFDRTQITNTYVTSTSSTGGPGFLLTIFVNGKANDICTPQASEESATPGTQYTISLSTGIPVDFYVATRNQLKAFPKHTCQPITLTAIVAALGVTTYQFGFKVPSDGDFYFVFVDTSTTGTYVLLGGWPFQSRTVTTMVYTTEQQNVILSQTGISTVQSALPASTSPNLLTNYPADPFVYLFLIAVLALVATGIYFSKRNKARNSRERQDQISSKRDHARRNGNDTIDEEEAQQY